MRIATITAVWFAGFVLFASVGCATAPETPQERAQLLTSARAKLDLFKQQRPGVYQAYEKSAAGVAVFPHIGKGGYGLGGSYGRGVVLIDNKLEGYCDITSGTFGWQIGGQEYSQVIFFADKDALREFQRGDFAFAGNASAVAGSADATAAVDYEGGVAVFTLDGDGAMLEAAIGAQQFSYQPASIYNDD
jgi:lipid-binding SYLF domain-containing protein